MASLAEMIKKKRESLDKGRNFTKKLKPGQTKLRVMPYADDYDDQRFMAEYGQYYIKNVDGTIAAVVAAADIVKEEPCPVGAALQAAIKGSDNDDMQKLLTDAKPTRRVLLNAIDLDVGGEAETFEVPNSVGTGILTAMGNFLEETGENPLDPDGGRYFIIDRSGSGLNTEYKVSISQKPSPVKLDVVQRQRNLEDFKSIDEGDQRKAIAAIQAISGVAVASTTAIAGGTARAALAAPSSETPEPEVDDASTLATEADEAPFKSDEEIAAEKEAAAEKKAKADLKAKAEAAAAEKAAEAEAATADAPAEAPSEENLDDFLNDL